MKTGSEWVQDLDSGRRCVSNGLDHQKEITWDRIAMNTLRVSIRGSHYLVDFGADEQKNFHRVNKDKQCSCGVPDCIAIAAVRSYLLDGGQRAPEPKGIFLCPICGSKTTRDHDWDGKYTRTPGWRCEQGSLLHFLEAKAERIRKNQAENPWLFAPVPGYPGLRRDEAMAFEASVPLSRKVFLENGSRSTL